MTDLASLAEKLKLALDDMDYSLNGERHKKAHFKALQVQAELTGLALKQKEEEKRRKEAIPNLEKRIRNRLNDEVNEHFHQDRKNYESFMDSSGVWKVINEEFDRVLLEEKE